VFVKPAYTISFILMRWLTDDDARNLARRTVQTYVYVQTASAPVSTRW
jgi:hypothetical protein